MKIRTKLAFQFTLLVATILIIFSLVIFTFAHFRRIYEFKHRLINKGRTTATRFFNLKDSDKSMMDLIRKSSYNKLQEEDLTLYSMNGDVLYSYNPDSKYLLPKFKIQELLTTQDDNYFQENDIEYVSLFFSDKGEKVLVVVSAFDEFGITRIKRLKRILLFGILISSLIIFWVGWLFAKNALKPIIKIRSEAEEISGKNLSTRLSTGNNADELAKLASSFNQMLDRIQRNLVIQKNFLSNASHELRTPLSIIRARIELALTSKENNHRETLEKLYEEIKDLIELSNGLLEITQLENGFKKEMMKVVQLEEVLLNAISECAKKYPNQKINLELDDEQSYAMKGFEALLHRCMANLIDNACKYSNGNSVVIVLHKIENYLIVEIKDSGIGIPSEELTFIKKPFFRASNTNNINGHGIGLSLVYRIVEVHAGEIEVSSTINKGTNVMIKFPIT